MEKKIGAYVCTGCGIGDALDIEQLSSLASSECSAAVCKTHAAFCSPEGAAIIKEDIANEGVNTVMVAACSPRVMYDVFNYENCIVDRVNLREQVVWMMDPENTEDMQMMAEDYVRMSAAKIARMELPTPYQPETEISRDIMVVGGGTAGLTAALEAAKAGTSVVLVEKQEALGGFQKNVRQKVGFPYKDMMANDLDQLIQAVQQHDKIQVLTNAKVEKTEGGPGLFDVTIKQNGSSIDKRFGAIVLAAGWEPYDPAKLDAKLGFGASPNVITNVKYEELCQESAVVTRPSDGGEVKNAAFLQCAGQRDPKHLAYCSSICCLTALKQALQIKENNPDANVYVVYKELRTPGQAEDFYRKAQEAGVLFVRCQDPEVQANGTQLKVLADDELLGEQISLEDLDLVVLATGMVPVTALGESFKMEAEEEEKKEGDLTIPPDKIRKSDLLNLEYRQGPEVPLLNHGFPDSHFICFPYESRRTGIYPAGCVRRATGTEVVKEDATGAALKAIQCIELTSQGAAVHPRAGDLTFPEFFMQRCTQCKRCTEECPFGAINEDEKGNPLPQPTRCRRCGVCMGACPERIISFKNYSVGMIGDMIKAIEVPDEYEEKPRVVVLACENDAYAALDMVGLHRMQLSPWIRVIPMRCLGSMNLVWIADSLSKGIDGVLLLGCQHGDNYQCHFIKGSQLAELRLSKVRETLERLVLESERVQFKTVSIIDYSKLPQFIAEYMEMIDTVGPNPYKGF